MGNIFHAYDIRGIYPDEINEEVVFKIAAGLVKFLNPRSRNSENPFGIKNRIGISLRGRPDKLIVAHDGRKNSKSLKEPAITAIMASGADVIDIGLASSPLFYFAVNRLRAGGGVMITASHNPPDYSGLKLVREKAIVIGESSGLSEIKNLSQNIEIKAIKKGKVITKDLNQEYADFLLEKAGFKKEPEIPENTRFEFDPDSDRLLVYEKNHQIRADLLSGAIIKDFLDRKSFLSRVFQKSRFICDSRFSKAIPEYIGQNKGIAIRSRVGHPFIKEAMRRDKALFGAELSGHFYFKDVFYVEAPILMKLKLLKIMEETGKSLSELIEPFQKYFHSGEINIEIKNTELGKSIIQKIKESYKDGKTDELDGITVEYWSLSTSLGTSWWFNLRPSNTEPVLRLVVEAETRYIMDQKVKEIIEAVHRFFA